MNEYIFSEIQVGQTESFTKEITSEMEDSFREMTGDINPLHIDDDFAEKHVSNVKKHVSFGMLTASLLSTMAGVHLPGKYSLIHSVEHVKFLKPVFAGDFLTVTGTVEAKQEALKLLCLKVSIRNQCEEAVLKADMKVIVLK